MKTKKLLLLTGFILTVATAFPQSNISGGIVAGANYSYLNSKDALNNNYDWKWKFGPAGGVYLNIPFGTTVSLQPMILYSQMGARYYYKDITGANLKWTQTLGYVSVPVPLKINAGNSMAFLVGPQIDFLVGARLKDAMGNATKNEADWDQLDVAATGGIQIMPNSPVSLTLRYVRGFKNLRNVDNAASGENQIASTVTNAHNSGVQAVLNFRLFGGKQKAVAITTPQVPVVATIDSDSDGIADNMDKCPNTPGVASYDGCPIPDTDKDGINDDVDKCPTVPGVAKYNGCPIPDTDNDGINDENDKCPTVPGVERYHGCPIPDSDNDGVNDEEDNCPHLAGTEANHGCPAIDAAVQGKIDMMATHIAWSPSNSYRLSAASNRSLDQIASMLTADTALKVTVTAHSAKTLNATKDQELSENRAETVKDYLLGKGVKEKQIDTKAYGSEQPVADNKTAAGRAKNQRVELRLHY